MDKNEIKRFTIVTLGDFGVVKISIINRYVNNKFDINRENICFYKEIHFNNKDKIMLKLVDTAGQEKYRALTKSYFKNLNYI